MSEGKIYIMQDVPITLVMPDDSEVSFILQRPNSMDNAFMFDMVEEAPGGQRIYKDPARIKRKAFADYYPVFYLNYDHHRMFTTYLLVAKQIQLKTNPGFMGDGENMIITNCIFQDDRARRSWKGNPVTAYSSVSEAKANPIRSGSLSLTLLGQEPLSWQEALTNYYFYHRRDSSELLASSSELISNPDIIISE